MRVKSIAINAAEYGILIREAVDGKALSARFGPRWVSLDDVPENEWAFKRLDEMRRARLTAKLIENATK